MLINRNSTTNNVILVTSYLGCMAAAEECVDWCLSLDNINISHVNDVSNDSNALENGSKHENQSLRMKDTFIGHFYYEKIRL